MWSTYLTCNTNLLQYCSLPTPTPNNTAPSQHQPLTILLPPNTNLSQYCSLPTPTSYNTAPSQHQPLTNIAPSQDLTLVMHHDPSGPGVALEKSTIPEKSGSSGSWMGEKGRSGSGPAEMEERDRAVRRSLAWGHVTLLQDYFITNKNIDNYITIWHWGKLNNWTSSLCGTW